jgi:Spy/CpxP family protein refolding chaperone
LSIVTVKDQVNGSHFTLFYSIFTTLFYRFALLNITCFKLDSHLQENHMRKLIITLVSASILTLSLSVAAFACGGSGQMLKSLELSASQDEKIHQLFESKRDDRKIAKEKRLVLKEKRKTLIARYSESLANEIADDAAELARTRTLKHIQHQQDILAMLESGQKETFIELMKTRHAERGNHHHKTH